MLTTPAVPAPLLPALGLATLLLFGCDLALKRPPPDAAATGAAADSSADSAPAPRQVSRRSPRRSARSTSPPGEAAAQPADSMKRDAMTPPARPSVSAPVRSDLQRLVAAQEQHLANVGRYASRAQYLALRYLPHSGVNVAILSASDSGWAGRATREGWDGRSCVVWVGRSAERPRTERQGLLPPGPGVAVCDPD